MDLNVCDVIRGPWLTQKAHSLNQDKKQLVFGVHPKANKSMIAYAIKKLFDVDVVDVRIVIVKGKKRRHGRHYSTGIDRKKAIVLLPKNVEVPTDLSPIK